MTEDKRPSVALPEDEGRKPVTYEERKVKHLELIQGVINRMAGNSFTIKGWGTALIAAILAFLAKDGRPQYAWIAILPTIVFWFLDAYYLSLERAYRGLYDSVRGGFVGAFTMDTRSYTNLRKAFWSQAVWPIYLMLIVLALIVYWYVPPLAGR